MVFRISNQITSWSWSRFQVYDTCPVKAYYKFILKLPEPGSPAMDRGSAIHKESELYVKGVATKMPKSLASLGAEFKAIRAARRKNPALVPVEETWALRRDWSITQWNDWNGCWVRIKLDAAVRTGPEVMVNDVKTGKYRADNVADYERQLELYRLGALVMFGGIPNVRVRARLLYVDEGMIYPEAPEVNTAKDLPALKKKWEAYVKPMMNDLTFAPKPNWSCKFCHYRKDNQGPCRY